MAQTLHIEIQDTYREIFRKTIEYLLANTFVIKAREDAMYRYLSNPSNLTNINSYFWLIGYTVYLNKDLGIAQLQVVTKDDEPARYTTLRLDAATSRVLVLLAKIYQEQYESGKEVMSVTMRELTDQLEAYKIKGPNNQKKWIERALDIFKKHSIIDYDPHDLSEDKVIIIHDTIRLLLGEHIDAFKENVSRYIDVFNKSEISSDDEDECEPEAELVEDYDENFE